MGRAREVGWMAAGLMIGAGACYCMYKLTVGRDDDDKMDEEEEDDWDDQDLDDEDSEIWFDFTAMARPWSEEGEWDEPGTPGGTEDRPSGGGKANRAHPMKQRPFPYGHKNTRSAQSFQMFSCGLHPSKWPSIQRKTLFAQATNAGFSLSQNVNSHLASLSMGRNKIPRPRPTGREKAALRAPENLDVSNEKQGQIEMYGSEVCPQTLSHCRDSLLQQAGLNLLISMTVINNMLAKSVADLKFPLLSQESRCAKVQVWQPPKGLSEKPVWVAEVLGTQMLFSFLTLFVERGARGALQGVLSR